MPLTNATLPEPCWPRPLALLSKSGAIPALSPCLRPGSPRAPRKSCSPSQAQRLAPAHPWTMPGKGLVPRWQLPWQDPPRPESPQCTGARHGPGLPPKQLSLRQEACWQNRAMQAGSEERAGIPLGGDPPQPARGPDSSPSFEDLLHLVEPTPPPDTSHPAPDSKPPPRKHKPLCRRLHQPCLEKSLNPLGQREQ